MPRVVSNLNVRPSQSVKAGDVPAFDDAMKTETALQAGTDGAVATVHGKAGYQIDAKGLLAGVADARPSWLGNG